MISVKEAFSADTTIRGQLYLRTEGFWDADNQWVAGGVLLPKRIRITPIPAGDKAEDSYGESLQARRELERVSRFYRVRSPTEMPINSILKFYGKFYKVVKVGDYSGGGYHVAVCAEIKEFSIYPESVTYILTEEGGKTVTETLKIIKGE